MKLRTLFFTFRYTEGCHPHRSLRIVNIFRGAGYCIPLRRGKGWGGSGPCISLRGFSIFLGPGLRVAFTNNGNTPWFPREAR
jgi:hypothetical protein